MTVRELMEKLASLPPDLTVYAGGGEYGPMAFDEDEIELATVTDLFFTKFDHDPHYHLDSDTEHLPPGTKIVVIG